MITCPKCSSQSYVGIFRSAIDPAEDKFKCRSCGEIYKRYAPQAKKGCPYCGGHASIRQDKDAFFTDAYVSVPAMCDDCGADVVLMYDFKETLKDV